MLYCYEYVQFSVLGKRRFNIKLWKTFTDCFNCLPIAAIIDEKIFCCHGGENEWTNDGQFYRSDSWPDKIGQLSLKIIMHALCDTFFCLIFFVFCVHLLGLSPDLQSMEQIRRIMRPTDVPDTGVCVCTRMWQKTKKVSVPPKIWQP